jgi:hypothetical protein
VDTRSHASGSLGINEEIPGLRGKLGKEFEVLCKSEAVV